MPCWCRSGTSGASRAPASGSRTAATRAGSTASTTAGSGSTTCAFPRDALLDRYGQVAADGTYSSPVESRSQRFFTMLGALVRGRVSVGGAAAAAAQAALAIAVEHGENRAQFARPGSDGEVTVLDYLAHQRRLLPALATSYALHFAQGRADLGPARRADRRHHRRRAAARAGVPGRGHQGDQHLARDRHHPGLPRGVRRCRLPLGRTGWCSSRPTATCSRPSRATTRC